MYGSCETGVKKSVELTKERLESKVHGMMETSGESCSRIFPSPIFDNRGSNSSCRTLQAHPFLSANFVKTNVSGRPILPGKKVLSGNLKVENKKILALASRWMTTIRTPLVDSDKHPNVSVFDMTDDFVEQAEEIIRTSDNQVPAFWKDKYEKDNSKNWDTFYKHNETKFFKDRHYIPAEFEMQELCADSSRAFHVVDMGCGVGNALLPMLQQFSNMTAKGFDCSSTAVGLLNERLRCEGMSTRCQASAIDMTDRAFDFEEFYGTADFVLLLFVQSAISPEHYEHIVKLASKILKPSGSVLFRDYGRYDMAQLRFEASSKRQGNRISDGFYVRGDGTRAKFFTEAELRACWEVDGTFKRGEVVHHTKLFVNRKTNVEMKRIWLQGKWTKPS